MNMPLVLLKRRRRVAFSPVSLFATSEPGVWYDPSDLTTMFQDTAGTIPVTTPGQTVARINDKSGRGNNATQATTASQPTYGIVPLGGRRNLLTFSEQFDNAAWIKNGSTVTVNAATAPDGTLTADALTATAISSQHYISASGTVNSIVPDNTNFVISCYFKPNGKNTAAFSIRLKNSTFAVVQYDLLTQTLTSSSTIVSTSISAAANGFYRVVMVANSSSGAGSMSPAIADTFATYTGDGSSGILIWGAQLELGSTATSYQCVATQYDVTEAGVQSLSYLFFDGVANFLVTPTITPGIDKAQVFAGVRKLTDVARGTIVEHSDTIASNNGSFHLTAPNAASATFGFESKGTTLTDAVATFAAPTTRVVTGIGDIAGDSTIIRANGTQQDQDTADQGTGNYLAYPLYIGRRGGTTLPFSGQIYNLIVRFGATLDAGVITSTETFVNQRTGAF